MRLLIIIPYRDRAEHLNKQLQRLERTLRLQGIIDYHIIVSEQVFGKPFNRGKILNVGFLEAMQAHINPDYIITHDVDLIAEDCDYSYSDTIQHLSAYCSQFNYELPDGNIFGGVNLYPTELFWKINGYSNEYWGWGREDEDMLRRVWFSGLDFKRREGRFNSLFHAGNYNNELYRKNSVIYEKMLDKQTDFQKDGLNNCTYHIIQTQTNYADYKNITKIIAEI